MTWNKYLTIEVPLFMCMFCMLLQGGVLGNLNIYRTCYVLLGYNESDCVQLGRETNNVTRYLEKKVQPTINSMQMVTDVVTSVTLIFCMYVGIWSDKFGRKPFLLLCLAGMTTSSIIYAILMFFHNASPWWFLLCQIPTMFTGNFTTLFIVLSTYVADVTTTSDRMLRMALFQVVFGAGGSIGSFVTPYIVYGTSYEFVFCLITLLQALTFLYAYFFIPESLSKEKEQFKFKNLLKYVNFMELIRCAFKKRPNKGRLHIMLNIFVTVATGFIVGESTVMHLFLRAKLHWTLSQVTSLISMNNIAGMICTGVGTYIFYQKLKIREIPLCILSIIACMITNLLRALATNDYFIYSAAAINLLSALGNLMIRTLLTFMVAPDEMGKIISLLDITLNLTGTMANFIYPWVYKNTIDINPAIFNYISFGGNTCALLVLLYLLTTDIPYYTQIPTDDKEASDKLSKPKELTSFLKVEQGDLEEQESLSTKLYEVLDV